MAGKATQLALDLRHRAAMGREDFLVSPSNEEAVAWIDRWPDWPGHALVLVGPPGCGKTHLGQVWQGRAGAQPYRAEMLSESAGITAPVFVDDADGPGRDEELFHLFNAAGAAGSFVLFACRTAPARWENRLPDLKSRLAAAPNIQIQAPDTPLIAAVMMKMFADEQMDVGADVLVYLVNRMERSFEAARTLAERLNNASLATRRGITIPLAREVFDALESDTGA
ncbi:MAG: chromosomal replication initiation ATPase DnaA [Paracoccaceae bacterium]|jgi:chromosomal replication initiation ATPase DnaA